MNFEFTPENVELQNHLRSFIADEVEPALPTFDRQLEESGTVHFHPPVLDELKEKAQRSGLWNLFHPDPRWGAGLTNLEYAPLAELMGSNHIASEACNCSAPDTGNMEVLSGFGTPEQQDRWLKPLLAGEIRSAFGMTEPGVASSDATNMAFTIEHEGDEYVLNGRKWWTSGVLNPRCEILIVMGRSNPEAPRHKQHSMVLVPVKTDGLKILRNLPVFGYQDREGHGEVLFEDVRIPVSNLIGEEGGGFAIAQARLGPGRIHHCMRTIGVAEMALKLMCRRALDRTTFGEPLATRANIQDWIAESRVEIEMSRLLVLKTAWMMDKYSNREARNEIAAIKVAVPNMALKVIDRAIQVFGGAGVSDDFPLAMSYAHIRTLRIADGPDEVHKLSIARRELQQYGGGR